MPSPTALMDSGIRELRPVCISEQVRSIGVLFARDNIGTAGENFAALSLV